MAREDPLQTFVGLVFMAIIFIVVILQTSDAVLKQAFGWGLVFVFLAIIAVILGFATKFSR